MMGYVLTLLGISIICGAICGVLFEMGYKRAKNER